MENQTLNLIFPIVQRWYGKNSRRSISATFRHFRTISSLSFFGDYVILSEIIKNILSLNISPSRHQVLYALNKSDELRHCSRSLKITLLEQLINPSSVALESPKNSSGRKERTKANKHSLKCKER